MEFISHLVFRASSVREYALFAREYFEVLCDSLYPGTWFVRTTRMG